MSGRVKGFAPWTPHKKTEAFLADIERVLEEYRSYLPMTVRQVFYRLVGLGHPKSENFANRVQETCNRARRAGRIPFSSIRDDGVSRLAVESALDLEILVESQAKEQEEREEVQRKLDVVNEALRQAFGLRD